MTTPGIKIVFFVLAVAALLFIGFLIFTGQDAQDDEVLVSQKADQGEAVGELLSVLDNLKRIQIDTTVFDSEMFRALRDFSVTLTPLPSGRANPFSPLE